MKFASIELIAATSWKNDRSHGRKRNRRLQVRIALLRFVRVASFLNRQVYFRPTSNKMKEEEEEGRGGEGEGSCTTWNLQKQKNRSLYDRIVRHTSVLQAGSRSCTDNDRAAKRIGTRKRSHQTTTSTLLILRVARANNIYLFPISLQFLRLCELFPTKRPLCFRHRWTHSKNRIRANYVFSKTGATRHPLHVQRRNEKSNGRFVGN